MVATDILRKRGKLKIYLSKYDAKFETFKDVGCSMGGKRDEDFYGYDMKYTIQVYNKSDTPKIMRDFRVIFFKDKKEVYSLVPSDEGTRRYTAHVSRVDEMEISNIAPKEIQVLDQTVYIMYDELDRIEGVNKVELQYKDEKDKNKKYVLSKKLITKSSYSQ